MSEKNAEKKKLVVEVDSKLNYAIETMANAYNLSKSDLLRKVISEAVQRQLN